MLSNMNIFVDFDGLDSLCGHFTDYFNRTQNARINTQPGLVVVSDTILKVISSRAIFEFEVSTDDLSGTKLGYELDELGLLMKACGTESLEKIVKLFMNSHKFDSASVIFNLEILFDAYFRGDKYTFAKALKQLSSDKFDYDENTNGDYRFWYNSNGDWKTSNFKLFTDYLHDKSKNKLRPENTDEYLIRKYGNHLGYRLINYILDMLE